MGIRKASPNPYRHRGKREIYSQARYYANRGSPLNNIQYLIERERLDWFWDIRGNILEEIILRAYIAVEECNATMNTQDELELLRALEKDLREYLRVKKTSDNPFGYVDLIKRRLELIACYRDNDHGGREGGKTQSIMSVRSTCMMCGWWGTVGEMYTDVDGDGSLDCPNCGSIIPVGASPGRLAWKLRLLAWVKNIFYNKVDLEDYKSGGKVRWMRKN